jgi:hypothetical protein
MKAYIITTGVVFTLIALAHAARIVDEGPHLAREPFFIITTVMAVGLSIWAWRVLGQLRRTAKSP